MGSFRVFSQRTGRLATLAALTVATLAQGMLPALASADSVTSRSVALSSSSAGATSVTYKINFTTTKAAAGGYTVEFCKDSPVIGGTCTAPGGFSASGANIGGTATDVHGTNIIAVGTALTAAESVSDEVAGITNPTSATDPLYARITTYGTAGQAATAAGVPTDNGTGAVDSGSVAIAITNTVGVSGVVRESLEFCVSGDNAQTPGTSPFDAGCVDHGGNSVTTPNLKLGQDDGTGALALNANTLSTGTIFTQLSTNAVGGVVVSLKSNAASCGGLVRVGDGNCTIKPQNLDSSAGTVAAGSALFGVKTGAAITDAGDGALNIASGYSSSTYKLNAKTDNSSGVTSTYGDEIFSAPGYANSLNMPLTFAASIAPNTPAGTYSATLGLIATGTF